MTKNPLSDADYARFHDLVREKSGLDVADLRRNDLERGVLRALAETGSYDTDALYRLLLEPVSGRPALAALIAELTVSETYFFRNQPQFEALERYILPDLIMRRRPVRELRIWSAGCASGEEPYSLAILLQRLLPDLARWNIQILATDINHHALDKARRGIYGPWSFRAIPPEIQDAYFIRQGRELAVAPHIRDMVTFAYLNLAESEYPSRLTKTHAVDLIVCRNVTIYFREETTRRVIGRFYDALIDGGWLIVGHAEPSQAIYHQFSVRNFPGAVVYQKESVESRESQPEQWHTPHPTPLEPLPPTAPLLHVAAPPRSSSPIPSTISAEYQEVLALWQAGQPAEALRRLEALAAGHPRDAQAPYLAAKIAAGSVQLEAAERWITLALQRAPLMAIGHYLQGLLLQEEGRLEEALAALRRCVYADSQFVLGHFALADVCARLGHSRRAQKALESVAQLLAGQPRDALIPEGDGLTVGRLLELVARQRHV